jgi:hypothetical protein
MEMDESSSCIISLQQFALFNSSTVKMKYLYISFFMLLVSCFPNSENNKSNSVADSVKEMAEDTSQFIMEPLDSVAYVGWVKHIINDVGFIYVPNEFLYYDENATDSFSKLIQPDATTKGIMIAKHEGDTAFVKITVSTKFGERGAVHKLSNQRYKYAPATIADYETLVIPKILSTNKLTGITIVNSSRVKEYFLNSMYCMGFSFKGFSADFNDTLYSNFFWINNNDRLHHINLGYTSNFYNRNKNDIDKIISSLRITDVQ